MYMPKISNYTSSTKQVSKQKTKRAYQAQYSGTNSKP